MAWAARWISSTADHSDDTDSDFTISDYTISDHLVQADEVTGSSGSTLRRQAAES
jgi:hypothetical protein